MSRKRKKYKFEEKKYPVEIYAGIDNRKPITVLRPENNYFCNSIVMSRDERKNRAGIINFSKSMKRGNV